MKFLIIIPLLLLSLSCTKTEIRYKYINTIELVPVEVTPPPKIERPILPIEYLEDKDKTDYPKISKAFVISIEKLNGYIEKLNEALDAYRPSKEDK